MTDESAQLAAAVHPKFKLDWVDDPAEKFRLTEKLKAHATALMKRDDGGSHSTSSAAHAAVPPKQWTKDMISSPCRQRRRHAVPSKSETISNEIDTYLADTDLTFTAVKMARFPTIRKMFIELNTGLPASAAVERLFSLGGRVFTPLRTSMSSYNFEMLMFLRMSKNF